MNTETTQKSSSGFADIFKDIATGAAPLIKDKAAKELGIGQYAVEPSREKRPADKTTAAAPLGSSTPGNQSSGMDPKKVLLISAAVAAVVFVVVMARR